MAFGLTGSKLEPVAPGTAGVLEPGSEALLIWPVTRLYRLNLSDLAHAWSYAPESRQVRRFAVPVAGGLVVLGFICGYFGWSTGLLNLTALYLVAERLLPLLRAWDAADAGSGGLLRISIAADSLGIDRELESYRVPHTMFYRWQELAYYRCPKSVVLCTNAGMLVIPNAIFDQSELGHFRELIERSARRHEPRFWVLARPLVVSLALLGWWALAVAPL